MEDFILVLIMRTVEVRRMIETGKGLVVGIQFFLSRSGMRIRRSVIDRTMPTDRMKRKRGIPEKVKHVSLAISYFSTPNHRRKYENREGSDSDLNFLFVLVSMNGLMTERMGE